MGIPLSIIGQGVAQVYFGEVSFMNREKGDIKGIKNYFLRNVKALLVVGILITIIAALLSSVLVFFVIGKKWLMSIYIILILIPMYITRFVFSPLSQTFYIYNKQEYQLFWNIFRIFTVILVFLILKGSFLKSLIVYSVSMALIYLILGYLIYLQLNRTYERQKN